MNGAVAPPDSAAHKAVASPARPYPKAASVAASVAAVAASATLHAIPPLLLLLPLAAAQTDGLLQPRLQLRNRAAHAQARRPASLPQRRVGGAAPAAEQVGDRARVIGEAVVGEAHRLREVPRRFKGRVPRPKP